MSTHGNIVINTLERAVSDDINNAESILNRLTVELGLALVHQKIFAGSSAQVEPDIRSHVASGLVLELNAGTLELSPGMLLQNVAASPPDVPTPGAYDSNFRLGLLTALEVQADPWDSTSAWWLLQSRVERITTLTETRDIYTPSTDTFSPSGSPIDKVEESVVVSGWKKGTSTTIPGADTGYAAIAGLYRPSGGGAITDDDIIQLSVQLDDLVAGGGDTVKRTNLKFYTPGTGKQNSSSTVFFDLQGEIDGKRVFARTRNAITIRATQFVDPTDSGSLGTDGLWWYVYLVPLTDQMPSHMYSNDVVHKGIVVISRVPPSEIGTNTAQVDLPDPIGGSVSAGNALCCAVFRASGVGSNVHYIHVSSGGVGYIDPVSLITGLTHVLNTGNSFGNGAHNLATINGGQEIVPLGVHLLCEFSTENYDTTPSTAYALEMTMNIGSDAMGPMERPLLSARSMFSSRRFELLPEFGAYTLTITPTALTAARAASGGGLSDMGNNEYYLWCDGIRF